MICIQNGNYDMGTWSSHPPFLGKGYTLTPWPLWIDDHHLLWQNVNQVLVLTMARIRVWTLDGLGMGWEWVGRLNILNIITSRYWSHLDTLIQNINMGLGAVGTPKLMTQGWFSFKNVKFALTRAKSKYVQLVFVPWESLKRPANPTPKIRPTLGDGSKYSSTFQRS